MWLDPEIGQRVIRKVAQVQEELKTYALAPDRPDLPVETFQYIISQMYKLEITKLQVAFEGAFLRGLMERYGNKVLIYVKKNMDEDWKRFIAVKELCHVMNDEEEDWSTVGVKTVRSLISEFKTEKDKTAPNSAQSEVFAEFAAIELLFPFPDRVKELDSGANGSARSFAVLSNWYKIPEVFIARSLSEDYHEFARQSWEFLKS
jgi:Zn-dependent peptidase ImmA (M78 family)